MVNSFCSLHMLKDDFDDTIVIFCVDILPLIITCDTLTRTTTRIASCQSNYHIPTTDARACMVLSHISQVVLRKSTLTTLGAKFA